MRHNDDSISESLVFVTLPQFEQPLLTALSGSGQMYWRAVTAAFPVEPWYMFSYIGEVADKRVPLTVLVAWEESLIAVIDEVSPEDHRAVYRVERGASGRLVFRHVKSLWSPTSRERADGLNAVFAMEGAAGVVDPSMRPVAGELWRRLVYRAGPWASE